MNDFHCFKISRAVADFFDTRRKTAMQKVFGTRRVEIAFDVEFAWVQAKFFFVINPANGAPFRLEEMSRRCFVRAICFQVGA